MNHGLADVQYIDRMLCQYGGDARSQAGLVLAGDGDKENLLHARPGAVEERVFYPLPGRRGMRARRAVKAPPHRHTGLVYTAPR